MGRKRQTVKQLVMTRTDRQNQNQIMKSSLVKELETHKLVVQNWCPQIAVSLLVPNLQKWARQLQLCCNSMMMKITTAYSMLQAQALKIHNTFQASAIHMNSLSPHTADQAIVPHLVFNHTGLTKCNPKPQIICRTHTYTQKPVCRTQCQDLVMH